MMVIEKIKGIIRKEKLDNMKHVFNTLEPSIAKHITEEIKPYVIMYNFKYLFSSINHFETVEKLFKQWERETKTGKEIVNFPEINLQQPKDDYVEYNENW